LTEGIVSGVGNVLVFLPQIILLFAFIGLLEDSGYMSRVAFLIDRVMRALGLHGRAFVPMLSGFACAVPAIMATRTLERKRDRFLTILVIPLMTCSARLPVYTLIISALFPSHQLFGFVPLQGVVLIGMYAASLLLTLSATLVLGRTVVRGHRIPLILELPPYRSWDFLRVAGTVILLGTVALWTLLSFPRSHALTNSYEHASVAAIAEPYASPAIEHSYGAQLGKAIEPVIRPLGFDWRIGVGLVGALAAREAFVSTMAIVYGIGDNANASNVPLRERMRQERRPDGKPRYSALVGTSLLAFFAIACQCISTFTVVRRETQSLKWPLFLFAYTGALAWLVCFLIYQGGRLLGLG
jgi:ferrous iron transport protein B